MGVSKAFWAGLKNYEEYYEALDIIKKNSSGKIWLVGGFVYRIIANQLYNSAKPEIDLDFIVEKLATTFTLSNGWSVDKNQWNNPKFVNGKKMIDCVPLDNIYSIRQRHIEAKIENYLTGVPLTIQSIAYDICARKLIGEVGMDALIKKVVAVNDLRFAEYGAYMKKQSLREMIQEKADSLGFTPIFPTNSRI